MEVFFSVGEPSGDLHGSNLVTALRRRQPDLQCVGYGGPKMCSAGVSLHADLTELAVMGIGPVLGHLPKFLALLSRADRYFRHAQPDAVVLIDYPGFNWWIARRAKVHGLPVYYYGAPQLWAWARWRVRKMRRLTDHVLCKLPFEQSWFRRHGCHATYVGHPYFDQLSDQKLDETFLARYRHSSGPLVTILPGSRRHEIKANLKCFLRGARLIRQTVPDARFAIASYNERQARMAQDICRRESMEIDVIAGRTQELIHLAHCCMACSGSVSLELLFHGKPTVIHYWVNRLAYHLLRPLIKVKYITLVNMLADDDPFSEHPRPFDPACPGADRVLLPEYPTCADKSASVAGHVIEWLTDDSIYERTVRRLDNLRRSVCVTGASQRCADYILRHVGQREIEAPRPHYRPATAEKIQQKWVA